MSLAAQLPVTIPHSRGRGAKEGGEVRRTGQRRGWLVGVVTKHAPSRRPSTATIIPQTAVQTTRPTPRGGPGGRPSSAEHFPRPTRVVATVCLAPPGQVRMPRVGGRRREPVTQRARRSGGGGLQHGVGARLREQLAQVEAGRRLRSPGRARCTHRATGDTPRSSNHDIRWHPGRSSISRSPPVEQLVGQFAQLEPVEDDRVRALDDQPLPTDQLVVVRVAVPLVSIWRPGASGDVKSTWAPTAPTCSPSPAFPRTCHARSGPATPRLVASQYPKAQEFVMRLSSQVATRWLAPRTSWGHEAGSSGRELTMSVLLNSRPGP